MNVAIILPYGGECPYRRRALTLWQHYWSENFPDYWFARAVQVGPVWNMAEAVNTAIQAAAPAFSRNPEPVRFRLDGTTVTTRSGPPDILILAGADSFVPPSQLREAVRLAAETPGYVRAFTTYRRLTRDASLAAMTWPELLASDGVEWQSDTAASPGVGAISREAWEKTGGYDPKFTGWGYEDMAWGLVHESMFGPWRSVPGTLTHHWHPTDTTDQARQREAVNSHLYYDRYLTRAGNTRDLLALRYATE